MKKHTAILCALMLAVSFGSFLAPSFADGGQQGTSPKVAHVPGVTENLKVWMNSKLGKPTVKEYHRKVHQNGTNCELCHGAVNPTKAPDDRNCLKCHGTREQVAQLTADLDHNPHNSPHYGIDAPCTTCHKEHQESTVYCNTCHPFKYKNFKK
ncbi:cytochrome c3 family protein [Desulfobaculum bizertense]|uniref:Cytochrome c3 n=1 Tax=Desulfobaculum bizertense DSM 18034 TaxID=1121442 RepID=A0A1T4VRF1_9BACT|nr:cytochrome c3 family protein [Desulfobaculum bizertense]UIJ38338.1 cytochrome c3 family protein [Desulfobaculum bizertense]SKA67540.1 Cytochrome c3 [Desulfobaculum bizertense DSM 18034]